MPSLLFFTKNVFRYQKFLDLKGILLYYCSIYTMGEKFYFVADFILYRKEEYI